MVTMMATMRKLEVVHKQFGSFMRKLDVVHKEVGGCTQGRWRLYTRELEGVYKEVLRILGLKKLKLRVRIMDYLVLHLKHSTLEPFTSLAMFVTVSHIFLDQEIS